MSGHSKWKQIKNQKGAADAKRGDLFTKLGNAITVATREGGANPETNFKLRLAIDRAKAMNMPKDNIDRAIKRGAGESGGQAVERVIYEAYGPGGSALIIESLTDNKNRSLGEIKNILKKHNANLAGTGSALYLFERKGAELTAKQTIKLDNGQKEKLDQLLAELDDSSEVNNAYVNAE